LAPLNTPTTASAIIQVLGLMTCSNAAARAVKRVCVSRETFAAGAQNSCQLIQLNHSTPAQLITCRTSGYWRSTSPAPAPEISTMALAATQALISAGRVAFTP